MSSQTWPTQRPSLSDRPEQLAWTVLMISFVIFCLLSIAIPWGLFYFIEHGTRGQTAQLDPILGTLVFRPSRSADMIAVTTSRDDVSEGSIIQAGDDATQGTLSFISKRPDRTVLGSAQIYSGTSIDIQRLREPIFEGSNQPYFVRLAIEKGQAQIFNNSGTNRALLVELSTPHGHVLMDQAGAYRIQVTAEKTDITVRTGEATLGDESGSSVRIAETMRAWVDDTGLHQASTFDDRNLIVNGEFGQLGDGTFAPWDPYFNSQNNVSPGASKFLNSEGREVLFFSRQEGENYHTEVGVRQQINQPVNLYDSLILQFDVKLLHQRPAGGGEQGSEFPLRVEIAYTDIYGNQQTWGHGLYYLDPLTDEESGNDKWSLANSEKIPQGQWFSYVSPNLITIFEGQGTRPDTIDGIRLYASGHKYQSIVSGVDLLAR